MVNDTDALPREIDELIATVVARTRLRRRERTDIARELHTHFRDGLAAGRVPSDLIRDFGDPIASARALRAGSLAKRSRFDRGFHLALTAACWGFGALVAVYAIAVLGLRASPPVISFDATAQYLAKFPVAPEGDQAWPLYKRGLVALADPVPDGGAAPTTGRELTFKNLGPTEGAALPGDPGWEQTRQAIVERQGGIDQIVAGSRKRALGYLPGFSRRLEDADVMHVGARSSGGSTSQQTMFSILLPQLSLIRRAATLVATDSLMAIERGHGQRFVDDVDAMLRLAVHVEEGHLLISQLVGTAIRALAFERVIMAMEWKPDALSDAQLDQLAEVLESIPASAFEADLSGEELGLMDFIQRTYSDDGAGDGYFNAAHGAALLHLMDGVTTGTGGALGDDPAFNTLTAPLQAMAFASRREVTELIATTCRRTEAESRRPLWEQDLGYDDELEQKFHSSGWAKVKWTIPRMLLPALARVAHARQLSKGARDAARMAVAMIHYRRTHGGSWPTTLADLSPASLPKAPVDPYNGAPLRYRLDGGVPFAWSVGKDGRDEAGQPPSSTSGRPARVNSPSDPDWVWFVGGDELARWKPDR